MKQVQQCEQDGRLYRDSSERSQNHYLRQMKSVCGQSQADSKNRHAGGCGSRLAAWVKHRGESVAAKELAECIQYAESPPDRLFT